MFIYSNEIIHIFRLMKEKRLVCFGRALTEGILLTFSRSYASRAYVIFVNRYEVLSVKETPISFCSMKNQNNNNVRVGKLLT